LRFSAKLDLFETDGDEFRDESRRGVRVEPVLIEASEWTLPESGFMMGERREVWDCGEESAVIDERLFERSSEAEDRRSSSRGCS
jgi:hypothetical protein